MNYVADVHVCPYSLIGCLRGQRTVGGGRKLQQVTTRGDAIGGE